MNTEYVWYWSRCIGSVLSWNTADITLVIIIIFLRTSLCLMDFENSVFYVTWFYFESCTKDSFIEVKNFHSLHPKGSLAKQIKTCAPNLIYKDEMVFCSFLFVCLFVPYTNPHFWTDLNQTLHTSPPSSGGGRRVCMDPQYSTLFDLFCQEPVQNPGQNMAAGPRFIATALYPWSSRRHFRRESSVI